MGGRVTAVEATLASPPLGGEGRGEGGVAGVLGGAGEPRVELGGEGRVAAVGDLEGAESGDGAFVADHLSADRERVAVGRVEGEVGRLSSIRIERRRSGMPSRIWGRGSETAVIWAVSGLT